MPSHPDLQMETLAKHESQRNHLRSMSKVFKNTPIFVPNKYFDKHAIAKHIKRVKYQNQRKDLYQSILLNFKLHQKLTRNHFTSSYNDIKPFIHYFHDIFPNQKEFGQRIYNNYIHNQSLIHTLALAPTQSGKTGSMLSIIYHAISHPTRPVPIQHIFIFTPHSSREWLLQTKDRFPPILHNNIFHRNNIKQLISSIQNKQNILLILDEVQIAFKIGQTTFNLFNQLGLYQPRNLFINDIKIVSFTATPNQLPQDFILWKQYATIQKMDVPESYISHKTLLQQNRLLQMKDLTCFDNVTQSVRSEAFDNIMEILPYVFNMDSPKFHIIRTPRANLHHVTIQNFKHVFNKHNLQYLLISESTIHDFDKFISKPPDLHTFIFIKDKLRCAKTLDKNHIGILYERFVAKPIVENIVQGLAGRLTGYHFNTQSIVFTHLPSIHNYLSSNSSYFVDSHIRKPSAFYPF